MYLLGDDYIFSSIFYWAIRTIADGYKYSYNVNGTKMEVKWHSADLNAATKFSGSNSGNGWTAQIKVGNKLLGLDGAFYRKPNNLTHIPLIGGGN
ncbi:MAG: hypothetical protein GX641_04135 [Mollicutes bacterium]|nr:hypothetical protein [Mollicutes bacterium]